MSFEKRLEDIEAKMKHLDRAVGPNFLAISNVINLDTKLRNIKKKHEDELERLSNLLDKVYQRLEELANSSKYVDLEQRLIILENQWKGLNRQPSIEQTISDSLRKDRIFQAQESKLSSLEDQLMGYKEQLKKLNDEVNDKNKTFLKDLPKLRQSYEQHQVKIERFREQISRIESTQKERGIRKWDMKDEIKQELEFLLGGQLEKKITKSTETIKLKILEDQKTKLEESLAELKADLQQERATQYSTIEKQIAEHFSELSQTLQEHQQQNQEQFSEQENRYDNFTSHIGKLFDDFENEYKRWQEDRQKGMEKFLQKVENFIREELEKAKVNWLEQKGNESGIFSRDEASPISKNILEKEIEKYLSEYITKKKLSEATCEDLDAALQLPLTKIDTIEQEFEQRISKLNEQIKEFDLNFDDFNVRLEAIKDNMIASTVATTDEVIASTPAFASKQGEEAKEGEKLWEQLIYFTPQPNIDDIFIQAKISTSFKAGKTIYEIKLANRKALEGELHLVSDVKTLQMAHNAPDTYLTACEFQAIDINKLNPSNTRPGKVVWNGKNWKLAERITVR